jgi:hypothetical protein
MIRVSCSVRTCQDLYDYDFFQNPVTANLKVGGGLSWHCRLPICAVGGDHAVHLWRLEL